MDFYNQHPSNLPFLSSTNLYTVYLVIFCIFICFIYLYIILKIRSYWIIPLFKKCCRFRLSGRIRRMYRWINFLTYQAFIATCIIPLKFDIMNPIYPQPPYMTLLNFFHSKYIIIGQHIMENLFYIGQQINNMVGHVHCCSNIMLSSNGQYCYFFKIIALYIYSIIHVHDVFTSHQ